MNLWNAIIVGFKEIGAHKFRSILNMLGIIIGVSSLVAMSALVKGMENGLREALIAIGGLERIRVEEQDLPVYQRHLADRAVGLTLDDVYSLEASAPLISKVTPFVEVSGYRERTVITYRGERSRPYIFAGTWPEGIEVNQHVVKHGRMFNEIDDERAASVCVIGTAIRDDLFGEPEEVGREIIPLGETIQINGQPFTIIGMFEHYESEQERRERELAAAEPAEQSGPNRDRGRRRGSHFVFRLKNNTAYIPLNTMITKLRSAGGGTNSMPDLRLSMLSLKIPSVDLLEPTLQQARNVLMVRHRGLEDFAFRTQEDWAEQITTTIQNARMSGGIIAAIALIVGGIGIMNIMLASISERVREIGIRKAVGATTSNVFIQIVIESVVIAVLGGLLGLFTSYVLVQIIANFTPTDNLPVITAAAMLFAFSCSVAIGLTAGLFPAIKASRLQPIQALRYD